MIKEALNGPLRRMHYVQRYSSIPAVNPENVAEHSWQIAMLCLLIGHDVRERMQKEGVDLDIGSLLAQAICHDVSEAMSGDIIRSFKHSSQDLIAAIERADRRNMETLCASLGGGWASNNLYQRWYRAKDYTTLEGKIVALADMLCVVSYCVNERLLGNRHCDGVLRDLYNEALVLWRDDPILGYYVVELFPNDNWSDAYDHVVAVANAA